MSYITYNFGIYNRTEGTELQSIHPFGPAVTDIAFTGGYHAMCYGMSILDVVAVMISPSQVDIVLWYYHYIYV